METSMQLSDFLTRDELGSIPESVAVKIESRVNKAIADYEAKGNEKFNTLVEAVSTQFDNVVNSAVKKKVDTMNSNAMSSKLYEAMQKIVNVLNECQIETNEVRDAKREVAATKEELKKKIVEYKVAMKKLMYADIAQIVFRETNGYKPEIQQKAVEYFTNPELNINAADLKREDILNYINGIEDDKFNQFSGIGEMKTPDNVDMSDLNEIADKLAIEDIELNGFDNYDKAKMAVNEVRYPKQKLTQSPKKTPMPKVASVGFGDKQAAFESLGRGLSNNKVFGNSPDVTSDMLQKTATLDGMDGEDSDVIDAMNCINDFCSFT